MYLKEIYRNKKPAVSFEAFPPKKADDEQSIYPALEGLSSLRPDFISVTCGAGGSGAGGEKTRAVAHAVQDRYDVLALAHLTCVGTSRGQVREALEEMRRLGLDNVLALRGDLPAGETIPAEARGVFPFAKDLIREIAVFGGFCVGAACYPEGHIECSGVEESIRHMQEKQEAGASFFITQLCFDNESLFRFLDKARNMGVTAPISCGIMPFLGRSQIQRMIFMCGASLPSQIIRLLHRYENSPEDLRKAGIEYAAGQALGLVRGGVDGIHIYAMNQPDIAKRQMECLSSNGYR